MLTAEWPAGMDGVCGERARRLTTVTDAFDPRVDADLGALPDRRITREGRP
jgi:hypothetical protein